MKIKEITKYELCKLAFKVKNKLLPSALLDTFDTYGKKHINTLLEIKIYRI